MNGYKFANLRVLLGYMYAQPGKKLLFMGGEFGQWNEWSHDGELDWQLLQDEPHSSLRQWIDDLNRAYRREPACTGSIATLPRLSMDRLPRQRSKCLDVSEGGLGLGRRHPRRVQLHARPAGELSRRRNAGKFMGGNPQ